MITFYILEHRTWQKFVNNPEIDDFSKIYSLSNVFFFV